MTQDEVSSGWCWWGVGLVVGVAEIVLFFCSKGRGLWANGGLPLRWDLYQIGCPGRRGMRR